MYFKVTVPTFYMSSPVYILQTTPHHTLLFKSFRHVQVSESCVAIMVDWGQNFWEKRSTHCTSAKTNMFFFAMRLACLIVLPNFFKAFNLNLFSPVNQKFISQLKMVLFRQFAARRKRNRKMQEPHSPTIKRKQTRK